MPAGWTSEVAGETPISTGTFSASAMWVDVVSYIREPIR